jgi:hypothetical protein
VIIQRVLKGIGGIDDATANAILVREGIRSNWLRNAYVDITEWSGRLTVNELEWHLNHFDTKVPESGLAYSELSPFISTTAGV